MAETDTVVRVERRGTTAKEEGWWGRILGHIDGLESTQVSPLIPILLGMMAGVAVAVLLLFASL